MYFQKYTKQNHSESLIAPPPTPLQKNDQMICKYHSTPSVSRGVLMMTVNNRGGGSGCWHQEPRLVQPSLPLHSASVAANRFIKRTVWFGFFRPEWEISFSAGNWNCQQRLNGVSAVTPSPSPLSPKAPLTVFTVSRECPHKRPPSSPRAAFRNAGPDPDRRRSA